MEAEPAKLRGTKIEVLGMLLKELEEDIWRQCRTVSPTDFNAYFETKYGMFKQTCPTLYRKALDGSFVGTDEHRKIMELAEDIGAGRRTKTEADSAYTWWMADKYRIQERYGKKQAPKAAGPKKGPSWLFD
jgi:hypothetical protein